MMTNGWRSGVGIIVMSLSIAGCFFYRGPAEKIVLDAEVLVMTADGLPAKRHRVYIVEVFGNTESVTADAVTDESGRIFLKGNYCAPMSVVADGGSVAIWPPAQTHYSINLSPENPDFLRAYGAREPRLTPAMIASRRSSC